MKTNHYDPRALHHRTVDNNALDLFRRKMRVVCPESMFLLYGGNRTLAENNTSSATSSNSTPDSRPAELPAEHNIPDSRPSELPTEHSIPDSRPSELPAEHSIPDSRPSELPAEHSRPSELPAEHSIPDSRPSELPAEHSSIPDNKQQNSSPDSSLPDLPFNDLYDFSTNAFSDMMDIYMNSTKLSKDEQLVIEEETRGQSSSQAWKETRKEKLTASNFGSAITCKVEPSNKVKSMLYNNFSTAATKYGNHNEAAAVEEYTTLLHSKNFHADCVEAGLLLSLEKPWLGASVDRLVKIAGETVGGLEVKCPYSKQDCTVEEAIQDRAFFLTKVDGRVCLKQNHKYYHQVQGQLYCCDLEWVDFVVYFGPGNITCERIFVDTEWQRVNLPKLDHFFKTAILPELLTRRVKRGKKLYQTGPWKPLKKN